MLAKTHLKVSREKGNEVTPRVLETTVGQYRSFIIAFHEPTGDENAMQTSASVDRVSTVSGLKGIQKE